MRPDSLSWRVVGEAWARPFIERTRFSLAEAGIRAEATSHFDIAANAPMTFPQLVRDALARAGPGCHSAIVPAGVVPGPDFLASLVRFLQHLPPADSGRWRHVPLDRVPREPLLAQGIDGAQSTVTCMPLDQVDLVRRFTLAPMNESPPLAATDDIKPQYVISSGTDTFQMLEQDSARLDLEPPVLMAGRDTLLAAAPGWVYRYNTEPIWEAPHARGCDVMVAVASGIKPWFLANDVGGRLRHLLLVDSSLSQLRFAYQAREAMPRAASWSAVCNAAGFRSDDDEKYRSAHDRLFEILRAGMHEWRFHTTYLHADVLAQTFRLIEVIRSLHPAKVVFWYSNVFQPHLLKGTPFSEDHVEVERSFIRLMQETCPGIVLYNSRYEPRPAFAAPRDDGSSPARRGDEASTIRSLRRRGYYISDRDPVSFDAMLATLHERTEDVFVVQIGAYDGVLHDPIAPAICRYHWNGILVEPQPEAFERLARTYPPRPGLILENVAIADRVGRVPMYRLKDEFAHLFVTDHRTLTSLRPDHVVRFLSQPVDPAVALETIDVPCLTLQALLAKHQVKKIDLLQIDAEGYDYEILKMLDFAAVRPAIIRLEHHTLSDADQLHCMRLLHAHDYTLAVDRFDLTAIRRG